LEPASFHGREVPPAVAGSATLAAGTAAGQATEPAPMVRPPEGKRILLSCKLGMIPREQERAEALVGPAVEPGGRSRTGRRGPGPGGEFTPEQAREAVAQSGIFVHSAINHAHWSQRLTSADEAERAQGRANIEHCLRVAHAAGGSGVLIVVGRGSDGPADEIEERCRAEIKKMLPLAASLGQPILIENVWNQMFYDHEAPPRAVGGTLRRIRG
jgi:L-ribulose-5-phosphate 3-epimerase